MPRILSVDLKVYKYNKEANPGTIHGIFNKFESWKTPVRIFGKPQKVGFVVVFLAKNVQYKSSHLTTGLF